MQEILKYIRKADQDFHLIEAEDVIVVGVSGGKDSVVLMYALSLYQKFKEKSFTLIAVHMNMGFSNSDIKPIEQFAKVNNIDFRSYDVPIYEILTHYKKEDGSLDCSRCSNLKRGAIVSIAKELHATKIAFAHHADDAVETFLMNAVYSGKLDTFKPKIEYDDNAVTFIRPLIYTHESVIIKATNKYNFPTTKSGCPNDGNTSRTTMKQLVSEMYKMTPQAKQNLINMLNGKNGPWKDLL